MGKRARGAFAVLAGAFEQTLQTPPETGYVKLPFVTANLGEERGLIASDVLSGGRATLDPELDAVNGDGDVVVPVDLRGFGYWLTLIFGAATTANATAAAGEIVFSAQPASNSTVTINGVGFTFVAGSPTGNQVQKGASLADTVTALATALNASAEADVAEATYAANGSTLTITHDTVGLAGNGFTLASSGTSNATPSGATLEGGSVRHTFVSEADELPSMALEVQHPQVPSFSMNRGIRGEAIKIALQRSGLLNATVTVVTQAEDDPGHESVIDGALEELELERFSQFAGEVKVNGQSAGDVVSAEFSYMNNLDKVEVLRADGRIADADPGEAAGKAQIVVRFKDHAMLDLATSGTPCEISFGWSKGLGKSLLITQHRVFLPKVKRPITGPKGVQATFACEAVFDPTLGKSCTVVLTNDIESY